MLCCLLNFGISFSLPYSNQDTRNLFVAGLPFGS
jgi:hypothetical protein